MREEKRLAIKRIATFVIMTAITSAVALWGHLTVDDGDNFMLIAFVASASSLLISVGAITYIALCERNFGKIFYWWAVSLTVIFFGAIVFG